MFIISQNAADAHARVIYQRLQPWFKRLPNTRYQIIIVNDQYDHYYNFYIEISRRHTLTRLVPLYEVEDYGVQSLSLILLALNRDTHLPIEFRQFSKPDQRILNQFFK